MSPRFSRLLTDWKTYVALLAGGSAFFVALTEFANKFKETLGALGIPPAFAQYVLAGAFGLLALLALLTAMARRSVLLRPERFIVSAEDPRHLLGREDKVRALAEACAKNSLAILKGESGAGKSALVKAGLLPFLNPGPEQHSPLLPLLVDASGLDWDGSLRAELAQALARWPEEWRRLLGDGAKPDAAGVLFAWLAGLPDHADKRLLLVLDQIDDYFVAHREHFLDAAGVVATPAALESANPDWAALAGLVRRKRIHLLLLCRKDEDMLSVLHFKPEPSYFPLARIETQLISPLLDELTRPGDQGEVVDDPEAGWLQLKARLLGDLAEDGQILPIRLALALDSLRGFRFLTLSQYSKHGGARGLERLYVEKHLRDAKSALGYEPAAVLRALALLTTEDGGKTQRAGLADFAAALSPAGPAAKEDTAALVDFLEQSRLLRSQSGKDGQYLLLYHDYLARGVRAAHRQANRWTELLRVKAEEFEKALTWRQRWQALLDLREQADLLWGRLRGRFVYGAYRALAGWSLLRLGPAVVTLALVLAEGWLMDEMRQEQEVANLLNRVGGQSAMEEDEIAAWRLLAGMKEPARLHAMRLAVSNPGIRGRLSEKTELLAHDVLGFDPHGNLSSTIAREFVAPCIHLWTDAWLFCTSLGTELHLRPGSSAIKDVTAALAERIKAETNVYKLSALSGALVSLTARLDGGDAKVLTTALAERMKTETDSNSLSVLGHALTGLAGKLDGGELKPLAAALAERMETETDSYRLSDLGKALAGLAGKLDGGDVKPAAAALAERMETETDSYRLSDLGEALAGLAGKLDGGDVKPSAAALAERMKTETGSDRLSRLGQALAGLADKLDGGDAKPLAAVLAERMKTEKDSGNLSALGGALAGLAAKLDGGDVKPGAAALAERMKTEKDSDNLSALSGALAGLAAKLDGGDVKPATAALAERMKTETGSDRLSALGQALVGLTGKLDGGDVKSAVAALVERMKDGKTGSSELFALGKALSGLVGKLDGGEAKAFAAALAERMKTETDSLSLSALGRALAGLIDKLDSDDVKPAAAALAERMKTETDSYRLSSLGEALAGLGSKLDSSDVKLAAAALAERIKTETASLSFRRPSLGEALDGLSGKLDSGDAKPLAAALAERMKTETNSYTLSKLGEALTGLAGKLDGGDVKPGAAALVERMKTETNSGSLSELGQALAGLGKKPAPGSRPDDSPVRIADYVELLRQPLIVGYARNALLEGLGKVTGQDFHGDLWQFVDWAQTEEGRRRVPSLE